MDILVIGAGPAGLAASAQLARAGLRVGCLAPKHPSPWPNNYGVWEDEIAALGLADCYERRYERVAVWADERRRHELGRVYLRLDNERLRGRLSQWCDDAGVAWLEGMAEAVAFDDTGATVTAGDGTTHRATLVVEATGHRPRFVEREPGRTSAFQAAYGEVARFDYSPIADEELVLMDYRDHFIPDGLPGRSTPTFLYAMALGDGRYFVEETSLAARPAMEFDVLESRLAARLGARDVWSSEVEEVERCLIPLDSPLPVREQRAVGFGAAASMVHPATGYQMAAMLRAAPSLARAIAQALGAGEASPHKAARAAWRALWPAEKVRARKMWLFGLECLVGLDAEQTRAFFDAFFALPDEQWRGYMSGTLSAAQIARAMWGLFRQVPVGLRLELGKAGFWQVIGS